MFNTLSKAELAHKLFQLLMDNPQIRDLFIEAAFWSIKNESAQPIAAFAENAYRIDHITTICALYLSTQMTDATEVLTADLVESALEYRPWVSELIELAQGQIKKHVKVA